MYVSETHQVISHRVHVRRDLLPSTLQTCNVCLAPKNTIDSDVPSYSLHLITEAVKSVYHVVDGILEDEYLSSGLNVDFSTHITVCDSLSDAGNTSDLLGVSRKAPLKGGRPSAILPE